MPRESAPATFHSSKSIDFKGTFKGILRWPLVVNTAQAIYDALRSVAQSSKISTEAVAVSVSARPKKGSTFCSRLCRLARRSFILCSQPRKRAVANAH